MVSFSVLFNVFMTLLILYFILLKRNANFMILKNLFSDTVWFSIWLMYVM